MVEKMRVEISTGYCELRLLTDTHTVTRHIRVAQLQLRCRPVNSRDRILMERYPEERRGKAGLGYRLPEDSLEVRKKEVRTIR